MILTAALALSIALGLPVLLAVSDRLQLLTAPHTGQHATRPPAGDWCGLTEHTGYCCAGSHRDAYGCELSWPPAAHHHPEPKPELPVILSAPRVAPWITARTA